MVTYQIKIKDIQTSEEKIEYYSFTNLKMELLRQFFIFHKKFVKCYTFVNKCTYINGCVSLELELTYVSSFFIGGKFEIRSR